MGAALARRLLRVIPQMLVLVTIAFALVHLTPGSTGTVNVDTGMSQNLDQLRGDLGLNRPLPVQYWDWLARMVHLDLGTSYVDGRPVLDKVLERLPATLLLTGTALLLSTVLGILLGVVSALKQNTAVDYAATVFAFFGLSIPSFWAGLLMILFFSVTLGLLPAQGMESIGGGGALDVAKHLIMPSLVLALDATAAVSRYVRTSMSEVLHEDYIRTARSKGLSERVVIGRHALRNALLPAVTILGLRLPVLVGGALLIETVFAWPGIGRLGFEAVTQRDYPVILGLLIFTGLLTILGNLLADVTYALVDPRVKVEG